ncbi:TPR domain protein in aerotolerance operon [hydrothermal vent metagenome]|uniref:TPR domain protein in aerotolerance operon n=1 Tax=hydrothermal vent metagenome TaxID=652676 RepID=A0A1W1CVH3_9ZZZZ
MILFNNIEFLWFLLLILPLFYFLKAQENDLESVFSKEVLKRVKLKGNSLSKRLRNILLLISMALTIIALARPQIDNGEIKVKSSFINIVTAIDMSKSMFANDVYPTRFDFAKKKFLDSLNYFDKSKIALIGFSSQTFLISPLTQDFHSLKFLAKNLNLDYLNLKGTDIMVALESANNLLGDEKKKNILIFTDGSDQKEFSKEIEYCKKNNIVVYIYNIGTDKGGVIKDKGSVLKDKNGNIVIVKRTDNIKTLAINTGGAYMKYSLANDDMKLLADTIQNSYESKKEEDSTIKDRKELFYYPLSLAILLFFIALFSIPKFNKQKDKK